MSNNSVRPWGRLSWVLERISVHQWSFYGCLSVEDRCFATWVELKNRNQLADTSFIIINDPPSHVSQIIDSRIADQISVFESHGGFAEQITRHGLFDRVESVIATIRSYIDKCAESGGNIIIDISSFPKRFFFVAIKFALAHKEIKNILVTYARPQTYGLAPLAQDAEPWRNLPTFGAPFPTPESKVLVIGMGFEPLGLPSLLEQNLQNTVIRLLFPFPPGPPSFIRTWEFMRALESKLPVLSREPVRVSAIDTSDAFDHLRQISDFGNKYMELAPYGPKPISLAMCLYACAFSDRSAVFYTQPTAYSPAYSQGVYVTNGKADIFCYCIRLDSKDLYTI